MARPQAPWPRIGDRVRIRRGDARRYTRTPWHARGQDGVVVAVHGGFPDADALAHGEAASQIDLVRVRLVTARAHHVEVDVYATWLDPVGTPEQSARP